jgi:biopolymer transport protein ExbD
MAQIDTGGGGQGRHDKKKKAKKLSTRIDMTPMVDLAFLLLTFFVLTSTFSKPKVLKMIFPEKKDNTPQNNVVLKHGVTIILSSDNRIFYYVNKLVNPDSMLETGYGKEGIRRILKYENKSLLSIREKLQKKLNTLDEKDTAAIKKVEADLDSAVTKDKFAVVVKHDEGATYSNMIDVVDELLITQVGRYYVADDRLNPNEKKALDKARAKKK